MSNKTTSTNTTDLSTKSTGTGSNHNLGSLGLLRSSEPSSKQDKAADIRDAEWMRKMKKQMDEMKQQLHECSSSVGAIVKDPARIGAEIGLGQKVAERMNALLNRADVPMTPEQRKDIKKAADFLVNLTPEKFLNKDLNTPWSVLEDAHASLTAIEGTMKNRQFVAEQQNEVNHRMADKGIRSYREALRKEGLGTTAPQAVEPKRNP